MGTSTELRVSLLLAALGAAVGASAAPTRYTFSGYTLDQNLNVNTTMAFTLTSATAITTSTSFSLGQFDSYSFTRNGSPVTPTDVRLAFANIGLAGDNVVVQYPAVTVPYAFAFPAGTFSGFGTFTGGTPTFAPGTLTISPVPEPGAFAAFGVGALALLRRRRRV